MHLTNRATKRPQRPSVFWGFNEQFSRSVCQQFDLSVEMFDEWYTERENRTHDEPAPKNAKPMLQVRDFVTVREILGFDDPDNRQPPAERTPQFSASEADLVDRLASGDLTEEERARYGDL